METKIIARHSIPGTEVTIMIEFKPATPWCRTAHYVVTREPNGATFVNYLSCGRDTEADARTEANILWSDAVQRRDAERF